MNYLDFFKKNIYPEVNNIFGIVQTNFKEKCSDQLIQQFPIGCFC